VGGEPHPPLILHEKYPQEGVNDMKEPKKKPNTPQKYGYASKVIPIRKRIWRKVLIRWMILAIVGVAFVILNAIGEKVPTLRNYPQMIILGRWMSAFVYGGLILVSGVLPLTFSREWTGIVRERRVEKYTKMPVSALPGPDDAKTRMSLSTRCVWTVERDNGYLEKVPIDTEEIWERYFEIGERVRMYKNAKILVKANPRCDDENLMCPLCGVMVMEPICRKCGVDFTEAEPTDEVGV
jgi:hypothetical protein